MRALLSLLFALLTLFLPALQPERTEPAPLPAYAELSEDACVLTVRLPHVPAYGEWRHNDRISGTLMLMDSRVVEETGADPVWVAEFCAPQDANGVIGPHRTLLQLRQGEHGSTYELGIDIDGAGCISVYESTSHVVPKLWFFTEGDRLRIRLYANPSTGFMWECDMADDGVLELAQEGLLPVDAPPGYDGMGTDWEAEFGAVQPGDTEIHFTYLRPWEGGEAAETRWLKISVADDLTVSVTDFGYQKY